MRASDPVYSGDKIEQLLNAPKWSTLSSGVAPFVRAGHGGSGWRTRANGQGVLLALCFVAIWGRGGHFEGRFRWSVHGYSQMTISVLTEGLVRV